MQHINRKKILYVVPALSGKSPLAVRLNIAQRTRLMKHLGHTVNLFTYRGAWSTAGWLQLLRAMQKIDILMIRIDGSCIGDMYTLAKLLHPRVRVVWETHGFPEENATTKKILTRHMIKKYQRRALSFLVDTCIYVSDELMQYAKPRVLAKNHIVIPNFVSMGSPHFSFRTSKLPAYIRNKIKNKFVVLWGGSPQFPWQGIDLIGQLSTYVEQIDLEILFVIIGKNSWYPLKQSRNVLLINNLDRSVYCSLLRRSDVCVAFYNTPPQVPLYFFPMKILDYMYYKKPVIASSSPVLSSIITNRENGFLVPNNVQDITFSIMQLKNNPELRRSIGMSAHTTIVSRFTDRQAQRAYRKILHIT